MNKQFLFFILSTPLSLFINTYSSSTLADSWRENKKLLEEAGNAAELVAQKKCQTTKDAPLEDRFRKWVYQAAIDLKLQQKPELIVAIDKKNFEDASSGYQKLSSSSGVIRAIGIDFGTEFYRKMKFGVGRIVAYHEVAHLVLEHQKKDRRIKAVSRKIERDADIQGAQAAHCYQCTFEYGEFRLSCSKTTHSINSIESYTEQELDRKIESEKQNSERTSHTHPANLERALYFFKLSRQQKKDKEICEEHAQIQKKEQERKNGKAIQSVRSLKVPIVMERPKTAKSYPLVCNSTSPYKPRNLISTRVQQLIALYSQNNFSSPDINKKKIVVKNLSLADKTQKYTSWQHNLRKY